MLCGSGLLLLVLTPLEAWVLHLIKWGTFRESFLPSLVMNLTSSLVGGGLVLVGLGEVTLPGVIAAFLLSILIEFGILMLFRRGETRKNLKAALYANALSYGLIITYVAVIGNY
jgi:ABC-type multidrug transport system permease subunit